MYQFPIIKHIDQITPLIAGKEEFYIADKGNYFVINYTVNFAETFPEIKSENDAILRECRGIKFSKKTGKIICRPFPKFFNLGEKQEATIDNVDFNQHHIVLQKLDGSFIAPFYDDDTLIYGTKAGYTEKTPYVEKFVGNNPRYDIFTRIMIYEGYTPIYEFLDPDPENQIVIHYNETRLVLLALREIETGSIMSYNTMIKLAKLYSVEYVEAFDISTVNNVKDFVSYTRNIKGEEGAVIRFDNGFMLKVKGDEYCQFHKTKSSLALEKDFVFIVANGSLDDTIGFLPETTKNAVNNFHKDFIHNVNDIAHILYKFVQDNKNLTRKEFALLVKEKLSAYSGILFRLFTNIDKDIDYVKELIIDSIKNACNNQRKLNDHKHLYGNLIWKDYINMKVENE